MNIVDLFKQEELTETNDGFKTICPHCGLQGGRTEGFVLFPNSNTSFCHSSNKKFNLLETAALKLKIITCIDGRDKDEDFDKWDDEEYIEEIWNAIDNEYGDKFLTEFKIACGNIDEFLIRVENNKGELISKKVNIDRVADYIIDKYDLKTIYGIRDEIIYVYEEGIWVETGKGLIKFEIESLLGVFSKNNSVSEILEKIKRKTETSTEDFNIVPEYKICLSNCVLDISNIQKIQILEHSNQYNFKNKIPIEYNEKSDCPKIKKFIEDTFYPIDVPQVQEWFGFHLIRKYLFKKAVIIHGPKNTGKSVFLNLLTTFLGVENVVDLSLQEISWGKGFDLLVLKNKNANIHDDLSSKDLSDGGGFKMAVGDGFISGEEKFGSHHRFRNSAKMTFACNKIPPVKDIDDDAYYDRWLTWNLDNIISIEDKNTTLINELTSKEELSGLLNYALEGYVRLVSQNSFSNEKDSDEIKSLMIRNSSPLARFTIEHLIDENGSKITKEDMYKHYCSFCMSDTPVSSPCSKEQLGRQLTRFAPFAQASSNGKERFWLNVKFTLRTDTYDTLQKPYREEKVYPKSSSNNTLIKLPKVSYLSVEKVLKKPLKSKVTKKSDREVQFWEAEECKNIVVQCTKEEVLKWIKKHPNYKFEDLDKELGIGCFKWEVELKREGRI